MSAKKLKTNLLALEAEEESSLEESNTRVEVICDSVQQALLIASKELMAPIENLDYEILQKGSAGILGIGKLPYRILVNSGQNESGKHSDLKDIEHHLQDEQESPDQSLPEAVLNRDGKAQVRIYNTGVYLNVKPHSGIGLPVDIHAVKEKIKNAGVRKFDEKRVERIVKESKGKPVKIAEWVPNPDADSTISVEVSPDEMEAYVKVAAPRPGGRHLKVDEVIKALKHFGVVFGYERDVIDKILEDESYGQQTLIAKGQDPKNGKDGYIDYKVRIEKKVEFKQDEQGRVDFLSKGTVENVVKGQLLAKLIPPQKGVPGRSVTGKLTPAENGKGKELKRGKGTVLSEDNSSLIAEKNGQAVYIGGKLHVEEVLTVSGDVGLDSGNIMFLGSVVVLGSVSDNMEVNAAGGIHVGGSVQKAQIEAKSDVVIRGGVQGRDKAKIESTNGSVFAKFIQNTKIIAEEDVIVSEAIIHSQVQAVGKVVCNGRRAQIVGGEVLAGSEVRAKQLGAQASTPTSVVVGMNPKILQQQRDMLSLAEEIVAKLKKGEQNIRTLKNQKMIAGAAFSREKEKMLSQIINAQERLEAQLQEIEEEKVQLQGYVTQLSEKGAVHVEKMLYPGVKIEINDALFVARDEYTRVTLIEEKGKIKIIPFVSINDKDRKKGLVL